MKHDARVLSLSFIPEKAVEGPNKAIFESGIGHYDQTPPTQVGTFDEISSRSRDDIYRFVNHLSAWVETDGETISDFGYHSDSDVVMGTTTVKVPGLAVKLSAPSMPTIQHDPIVHDDHVEFRQTAGGRTAFPLPRGVKKPPFVRIQAPLVWTTLVLRIFNDGNHEYELTGASQFPRHWVYNNDGELSAKAGTAEFRKWAAHAFGKETPWKGNDNEPIVAEPESDLERELAKSVLHSDIDPVIKNYKPSDVLMKQGDPGDYIALLIDGIADVYVNDHHVAQLGPGTVIGERALLEGTRTSSIVAATRVRVAETPGYAVDIEQLQELSFQHNREDDEMTTQP